MFSSKYPIKTFPNGYFDVWSTVKSTPFNLYIIIGGRRLGKTYSMLRGLIDENINHLYIRRTDADLDECLTTKKNPYRSISSDLQRDIRIYKKGKDTNIVEFNENDEIINDLGIAGSVSTSGSVRGAYFEDIDYLLYDEFINLKPVNTIKKKEGSLFLDLYDTANNDRDLRGKEPLKAVLLSNANTIDDGLLRVLRVTHIIYQMCVNQEQYYIDNDRGIYIALLPDDNEITAKRKKGAIGKLINGTSYAEMAMFNNFIDSYFGDIKEKVNFREYTIMCSFNDIYFYRHKGDRHILASYQKAKTDKKYSNRTLKKFKKNFGFSIGLQVESGAMRYHDYNVKVDVSNIFV